VIVVFREMRRKDRELQNIEAVDILTVTIKSVK
jgi:hypothetical protein